MASVGAGEGNLGQEFFLIIFKNDEIWGPIFGSGFGTKNGPSLVRVNREGPFLGTKSGPQNGTQNLTVF